MNSVGQGQNASGNGSNARDEGREKACYSVEEQGRMRLKKASEATKDLQRSSGRPDTDKAAQNGASLHNSKHRTSSPLASLHRSTAPASSPSLPQPQPHSHQAIPNPNRPSQPQSASPYSSTFPPHLQARTQDIQSRFEARARTNSAPHPLASSAASTSSPAPHVRSSSVQGRQVPNVNLNGSTPPTQVQRIRYEALYQIQKEASIYACGKLFDRVRIEIIQLAETGGIRIEAELEGTTLPTLSKAKLPTSGGGLANLAADMQGLLVSGITPMDYLTTFQRWHTYTSKSGEATFPICGPTVAAFLKTSSRLESGERPKLVWILDHYRKATIGVFDGLRRDEKWTMKLARNWGTVEWDAWDRFIALSKIRLGEWKIIEELAPATLPRAPLANRPSSAMSARSTSTSSRNASPASSSFAAAPTHPLQKALGKRRADGFEPSLSETASSQPSPVHPYGLNRYGQPRQKPFRKRKLPPEEQKADDEFYAAVRDCAAALEEAKRRKRRQEAGTERKREREQPESQPRLPEEPTQPRALPAPDPPQRRTENEQTRNERTKERGQRVTETDYSRPPSLSTSSLPRPYADFKPSLALHSFESSKPAFAFSDPHPLSMSLPHSTSSLHLTTIPLGLTPSNISLSPEAGVAPATASLPIASRPRLTLMPQYFIPYPNCLKPSSQLTQEEQLKSFQMAKWMAKNSDVVGFEKKVWQDKLEADEKEQRKAQVLANVVRSAIAEDKPKEGLLTMTGNREGEVRELMEPEAANRARERARECGHEPMYSLAPPPLAEVTREALQTKGVATVTGLDETEKRTEVKGREVDPKGTKRKRTTSEGEEDDIIIFEGLQPEVTVSGKVPLEADPGRPSTSSTSEELPTRPATVVPTVSISPPEPILAPQLPDSSTPTPIDPVPLKPRRPSLSSGSASAPVVPQQAQRSRSRSISQEPPAKMRRRTSITTPASAVHPLARLYASQSPQFRQGARLKAAEIVAATKNGIIPAAKSPLIAAKVLTEGAVLPKGSPRISSGNGGSSTTKSGKVTQKPLSPPLVPIPLPGGTNCDVEPEQRAESEEEEDQVSNSMEVDSNDLLQPPSVSSAGSSALGVILELPSPQSASISTSGPAAQSEPEPAAEPMPPNPTSELPPTAPGRDTSSLAAGPPPTSRDGENYEQEEEEAPLSTVTSNFTRLVRRLSSGLGQPNGESTSGRSALDTPARSNGINGTTSSTPASAENQNSNVADPTTSTSAPAPLEEEFLSADHRSMLSEHQSNDITTSGTTPETREGESRRKRKGKEKGKGKERVIETSLLSSPERSALNPARSPSEPRKGKEKTDKPVSRDKAKKKPTVQVEVVPPPLQKVLADHPLRRIPKKVLAVSEPVFPYGRSH